MPFSTANKAMIACSVPVHHILAAIEEVQEKGIPGAHGVTPYYVSAGHDGWFRVLWPYTGGRYVHAEYCRLRLVAWAVIEPDKFQKDLDTPAEGN